MSKAYYNENDPRAAEWLRNLIAIGAIADGDVDDRSIEDVKPSDLDGYTQCHFFAGIGGWSLALRLAGWPDDRPVWTGSCPCQPFSNAGRQKGTADSRHLFPAWWWLIGQRKPPVIFGEQVASKAGREWLAGVFAALEALGNRCAGADLCAAGVGAPHIRQRLYWVADAERNAAESWRAAAEPAESAGTPPAGASIKSGRRGSACRLGDASGGRARRDGRTISGAEAQSGCAGQEARRVGHSAVDASGAGGLGDADDAGSQGRRVLSERAGERTPWAASLDNWLPCADGKARRVEPGIEPLAHGVPGRVGLLRGYGNAIVPQLAAEFIRAYMVAA